MSNQVNPQSRSLFVVGDDAQSIYGFRGSKIELILGFDKLYPNVKEIILNQNYRSTQPILDLAEKILTHNKSQKLKNLHTQNPDKVQVKYHSAFNEKSEAEFIIKKIISLYNKTQPSFESDSNITQVESVVTLELDDNITNQNSTDGIGSMFDSYLDTTSISRFNVGQNIWSNNKSNQSNQASQNNFSQISVIPIIDWSNISQLNDVAILYRTHSQSRAIEESLIKNRVPYRLVSGTRFLDRKEVRDVLAILRYVSNGQDKLAFSRFLPLIMEGVGPKTLEKIEAWLSDPDYPLSPKYQTQVLEMLSSIQEAWSNHTSIIDLTKELLDSLGYNKYLKIEYPAKDEFIARNENIAEIYSLMLPFDQNTELDLVSRLREFLSQILLMSNQESKEGDTDLPKVNLLTLHQSKGLEYETVFLIGCEDGLLPHQNSFNEEGGIEEEVRLAYVGVTRAKQNLFLTTAQSRIQFGQIKSYPVSRIFRPFLDTHTKREFSSRL